MARSSTTSKSKAKAKAAADDDNNKKKKRSNNDDDNDDASNDDDNSSSSTTSSSEEEKEPKPVSSESEEEEDGDDSMEEEAGIDKKKKQHSSSTTSPTTTGISRLFAPYRTLGVVSSGRPFHLIPHESSQSSMLCVPIGDRFQLMQTDRLQPVLVSQAVPSSSVLSQQRRQKQRSSSKGNEQIVHCVTDPTLSITVVSHGPTTSLRGTTTNNTVVTLYHRTRPVQTQSVLNRFMMMKKSSSSVSNNNDNNDNNNWTIQSLLHIGRIKLEMKGEKEGKKENAAVVVAVLSNNENTIIDDEEDQNNDNDDRIPVVGDDDDSSIEGDDNDDEDENESSLDAVTTSEEEGKDIDECCRGGQVVVLIATRTTLQIHRRIRLSSTSTSTLLPNLFHPVTSMHPATYLNKIVIGGFVNNNDEKTSYPAMCLVNVRSSKVIHSFQCLPKITDGEKIVTMEQSPAVDTVAVGTNRGTVHLINLRHDKLLFSLYHKGAGGQNVAVLSISFRTDGSAMRYAVAPMAVGRSDGTITVWDLTPPEEEEEDRGATTATAGRTILTEMDRVHVGGVAKLQYLPQEPLLVSVGTKSNAVIMHIFDNPNHSGRILRQRKGHTAPPTKIRYLHQGSGTVLVNDGTDASSCQILSSGGPDRTLRVFSTVRSVLDKEYSQGSGLEKKAKRLGLESTAGLLLPPVKSIALSDCRSRDWGDLVTIHEDHSFAYVWSTKRGAQSGPLLKQPNWNVSAMKIQPPTHTHATSVAMSACGNFALVGTRGGMIYRYNVQSGHRRGSYPRDLTDSESRNNKGKPRAAAGDIRRTMKALEKKMKISNRESNLDKKDIDADHEARLEQRRRLKLQQASHTGFAVMGLAVDSVNKTLVSVGADSKLILWNFSTHAPHKKSPCMLPCAATRLCHIRESDLAAIALEDFSVVLFDCTSLMIVRRFGVTGSNASHKAPITDLGFSPDGRTLYTSSLDSTIRVFDVPTNACVDWLRFKAPPTSITVSPTGEFLATTHSGRLGISLWSDKSYYQTVHVDGSSLTEPAQMDEPAPISDTQDASGIKRSLPSDVEPNNSGAFDKNDEGDADDGVPEPKAEGLVTMSGLPPAHWKNLFHLELVKERNKPQEPPKKPPTAPFFLQWRGGEALGGAPENQLKDEASSPSGRDDEEWAAAWSDNDDDDDRDGEFKEEVSAMTVNEDEKKVASPNNNQQLVVTKRRKVTHYRSHLASLLQQQSNKNAPIDRRRFQVVTEYVATLGPSAIDVSLSSLCSGSHDLEEGLPLLLLACEWLIEACQSRDRFEVINAYLHRFLHVHSPLIAEIDKGLEDTRADETLGHQDEQEKRLKLTESLSRLKDAQQAASLALDEKLKHTLCLLRHFSRMV